MVSALYSSDDALIKATTPKAKRRTSKYSILMILFLLIPKNLHEVDSEVRQHIFLNILKYSDYKSKILCSNIETYGGIFLNNFLPFRVTL